MELENDFNPSRSEKLKRVTRRIISRRPRFAFSSFKIIPQHPHVEANRTFTHCKIRLIFQVTPQSQDQNQSMIDVRWLRSSQISTITRIFYSWMALLFRSRSAQSLSILNLQWHCRYGFFDGEGKLECQFTASKLCRITNRKCHERRKPTYAASLFFTFGFCWAVNFIRVGSNVLLFSLVGFLQQSCRWSWHRLGFKHGWRARPQSLFCNIRQSWTFLFPTTRNQLVLGTILTCLEKGLRFYCTDCFGAYSSVYVFVARGDFGAVAYVCYNFLGAFD